MPDKLKLFLSFKTCQALLNIDSKKCIQCRNFMGETPLHFAAKRGNTYMVDYLIKRGGDLIHKDARDRSIKGI